MQRRKVVSFDVDCLSFAEFQKNILEKARQKQSAYVCVANVHMVIEARLDKHFADVVQHADLVTPDGMPVVKALKWLHGIQQQRVAGMDLFSALIESCEQQKISAFFFGSTTEVLSKIKSRLNAEHQDLTIAGMISPPFEKRSVVENTDFIKQINDSGAGIVFVALGCPKQEKWMAEMKGSINAVMVGVGGAFPVFACVYKRAPLWMQNNSLEWLYRLIQNPFRLFKRYFVTNSMFILFLLIELSKKIFKKISS